jgi:hypothetical protein
VSAPLHHQQPLDPATYERHAVHTGERIWPETNCYVDLWIEALHARDLEPLAALPFTFAIDVEGDQWTFFKFPLADLYSLYGVEVIELNVWRPLLAHVEEQLALGRLSIVEVDAFWLPDTAGVSYRMDHVKTSIGIQMVDADRRRLGYFHNAGYFELDEEDFAGIFRLDADEDPSRLPPYVEVAKFHMRPPLAGRALVAASRDLLQQHLARRPRGNPFRRYAARFDRDLGWLAASPPGFHGYAFATLRQCGAAFELGAAYLRWLGANGEHGLAPIAAKCDDIAETAKTLQFKLARFVTTKRAFDSAPMLDVMAAAWDEAMAGLSARYGALAHHN